MLQLALSHRVSERILLSLREAGFDAERYCRRHLAAGHNAHMGFRYLDSDRDGIRIALPIAEHLRDPDGDPADAAVISLLDMAGTISVWVRGGMWWPQATVDLRVDWIRDGAPETELIGQASCETIRDDLAYVTGDARDGEGRRWARFAATYMITR